jgi:hypothetical protein
VGRAYWWRGGFGGHFGISRSGLCRLHRLRRVRLVRLFPPGFMAAAPPSRIRVEQGLLKTVGRAMPVLMPVSSLLVLAYALFGPHPGPVVATLRWAAVPAMLIPVVTTLLFNVPINSATARWDANYPPSDWETYKAALGSVPGAARVVPPSGVRAAQPSGDLVKAAKHEKRAVWYSDSSLLALMVGAGFSTRQSRAARDCGSRST